MGVRTEHSSHKAIRLIHELEDGVLIERLDIHLGANETISTLNSYISTLRGLISELDKVLYEGASITGSIWHKLNGFSVSASELTEKQLLEVIAECRYYLQILLDKVIDEKIERTWVRTVYTGPLY
jgi:hypothetical protein